MGQSIQDMDLGGALTALFTIIRRYDITLPPALSLLLRTLIELEGTAQRFSPEFSLAEVLAPFHATIVSRRFSVGASLAGSNMLITTGNGWHGLCRKNWTAFSEACERARFRSTWTIVISTRSSTAWCLAY